MKCHRHHFILHVLLQVAQDILDPEEDMKYEVVPVKRAESVSVSSFHSAVSSIETVNETEKIRIAEVNISSTLIVKQYIFRMWKRDCILCLLHILPRENIFAHLLSDFR